MAPGLLIRIWLRVAALGLVVGLLKAESLGGSPGFGPLKAIICILALGLLFASRRGFLTRPQENNLLLLAVSSTLAWCVAEVGFFGVRSWRLNAASQVSRGYVNGACSAFDPVAGYRWRPGLHRVVRVINGAVIFDNTFRANNAGYVTGRDFQAARTGPYRVVVLGDSFTAGEYLAEPWPDHIAARLSGGPDVYSFGIDGGGLLNWHSMFFGEIVPRYEFDALIIASFTDDLERDYCIQHARGSVVSVGRFPKLPSSSREFEDGFLPSMVPIYAIRSDETIDRILAEFRRGAVPPEERVWPRLTVKDTAIMTALHIARAPFDDRAVSTGTYADAVRHYGQRRADLLSGMINHCKERRIPVVLAAVPRIALLTAYLRDGKKTPHQTELEAIAAHHEVGYFDGYAAFAGLSADEVERSYWLKYDGHWNQRGSNRFAERLADALEQRGVAGRAHQAAGGALRDSTLAKRDLSRRSLFSKSS